MRQQLIEALEYPRQLVLDLIDERRCPYQHHFDPSEDRCRECTINGECHWVTWLDDLRDVRDTPTHTLSASLRYGIKLVRDLFGESPHEEIICACESCEWIRGSQRLIEEFDASLPPNRYRSES